MEAVIIIHTEPEDNMKKGLFKKTIQIQRFTRYLTTPTNIY